MHPIDDATLVIRLRAGDETAYELMVRTYGGRLLAVARGLLRQRGRRAGLRAERVYLRVQGPGDVQRGMPAVHVAPPHRRQRSPDEAADAADGSRRNRSKPCSRPSWRTATTPKTSASGRRRPTACSRPRKRARWSGRRSRGCRSRIAPSWFCVTSRSYHGRGRDKAGGHFERREDPVASCTSGAGHAASHPDRWKPRRAASASKRRFGEETHMTTTPAAPDPFAFHSAPRPALPARRPPPRAHPLEGARPRKASRSLSRRARLRVRLASQAADLRGARCSCSTSVFAGRRPAPRSQPRVRSSSPPIIRLVRLMASPLSRQSGRCGQTSAFWRIICSARIPELAESCFFVDPFGGADARSRSLSGMRAAHLWLRRGGVLVVFPAGEVAWQRDPETDVIGGNRTPVDSQWDSSVGRLALATAASVLPVYLTGHNSRFFYFAGRVHPRLRTVLLGRELLRHRRSTVHLRLASPMKSEALRIAAAPVPATALIREQVELQAHRGHLSDPRLPIRSIAPLSLARSRRCRPPRRC